MFMKALILLFLHLLMPFDSTDTKDPASYYEIDADTFFLLPEVNRPVDVLYPNYALLDAIVFHQTNIERKKADLPLFAFDHSLYKAAIQHTDAMVRYNFFSHENAYDPTNHTVMDRIEHYDTSFMTMGENIENHYLLDPAAAYCVDRRANGSYLYYNCDTNNPLAFMTYKAFAQACIVAWMNSKWHRQNILNPEFQYLACAVRIMPNPFSSSSGPQARLTQDFAGK